MAEVLEAGVFVTNAQESEHGHDHQRELRRSLGCVLNCT
jgi:hypothetical protein